jgi:hypothetical protein
MMRAMKNNRFAGYFGVAAALVAAMSVTALAAASHSLDVGGRYYQDKSNFRVLPYDDGDMAVSVAYEYAEQNVFWQLGCDVLPDSKYREALHYAVTPQLNLMLRDPAWFIHGGVGILSTFTHTDAGENWTDLYWQLILGLDIPVSDKWSVQANAFYVFDKWDHLSQFDIHEVDLGAYISCRF